MEAYRKHLRRCSLHLHDSPTRGSPLPAHHSVDGAFPAHRRGLDPFTRFHHSQKGDHSSLRKVDRMDWLIGLLQQRALAVMHFP